MQMTPSPRSERGFSMFIVIMAMFVTSMFVAAGFAAAQGGLSLSVENKNRKSSYNVAEAGLGYYLKELKENPDVWTKCAAVDAPNGTEKSPINQQWDGSGTDPRVWRKIPGVDAEYTIEILHQPGFTAATRPSRSRWSTCPAAPSASASPAAQRRPVHPSARSSSRSSGPAS